MASMSEAINPAYLQPGTQIGFYEVVTLVGKGGFGALYKVTRAAQVFALKLSTHSLAELSEEERASHMVRAKREAGALMQLRHPNVVKVHGFDQWPHIDTGYPYLVMDFVDGLQLYDWRRQREPTLRQVAQVFQKIALALNEIHRCEIFHRDLKSENVLIRKSDGEPVLVDFGLARPRSTYTVTHATDVIGSLSTFTPEYCEYAFSFPRDEKKKPFVHRPTTDLHAVGFMLYEALTGCPPFDINADRQIDLIIEIEGKIPARPSTINAGVPKSLDDITMKLLEKDPAERYQSGQELALALSEALQNTDAAIWDAPLKVPAAPDPDASTVEMRINAEPEMDRTTAKQPRGGAAQSLSPHAERPAEGEPNATVAEPRPQPGRGPRPSATLVPMTPEPDHPGAQDQAAVRAEPIPPATQRQTVAAPQRSFSPPIPDQSFLPPEGAAAKEERSDARTSLSSAIRKLPIADRGSVPFSKMGFVLVALGVVLIAVFGTALFMAKRVKDSRRPESLLSKFQTQNAPASELDLQENTAGSGGFLGSTLTPTDITDRHAPVTGLNNAKQSSRRPSVRNSSDKNSDEENLDALLASRYGRPNIPEKADARRASPPDPPWVQRGRRVDASAGKQVASAQKKLGVPFGTHLRARLATNLDSRTIGDGLVEATLTRPFLRAGDLVLPSRTMLYGQARTSGGRFTVQFFRLRLPDNTEVPFNGLAVDSDDNKPGLAASGRIAAPPASKESLASKVVKNSASTVLGKLTGDDATDVARSAGQTALSNSDGTGSYSTSDILLLDAGRDFEVVVKETF